MLSSFFRSARTACDCSCRKPDGGAGMLSSEKKRSSPYLHQVYFETWWRCGPRTSNRFLTGKVVCCVNAGLTIRYVFKAYSYQSKRAVMYNSPAQIAVLQYCHTTDAGAAGTCTCSFSRSSLTKRRKDAQHHSYKTAAHSLCGHRIDIYRSLLQQRQASENIMT